jgi:hypothetical protein
MKMLPFLAIPIAFICHAEPVITQARFEASKIFKDLGLNPQTALQGHNGWGVTYRGKVGDGKEGSLEIQLHLVESPYLNVKGPVIKSIRVKLLKDSPKPFAEDSKDSTARMNTLDGLLELESPSPEYKDTIIKVCAKAEAVTDKEDAFDQDLEMRGEGFLTSVMGLPKYTLLLIRPDYDEAMGKKQ